MFHIRQNQFIAYVHIYFGIYKVDIFTALNIFLSYDAV
jgi:hypothetical protein